jgi:hypothetical protein
MWYFQPEAQDKLDKITPLIAYDEDIQDDPGIERFYSGVRNYHASFNTSSHLI